MVYLLRTDDFSAALGLTRLGLRRVRLGLVSLSLFLSLTHKSLHLTLPLPLNINTILLDLLLQLEDLYLHRR